MLLATKLHVPRLQPGFVARPRLVQALDEGLARRLILVRAPAGFGKTALLAAGPGGMTGRWPGCRWTLATNDPARFRRHAVAALDQGAAGYRRAGGRAAGLSGTSLVRGAGDGADQRAGRRSPARDELLLVLDDYHLIDARAGR